MKSYGAMATFGPQKKNYRSRIAINIARSLRWGATTPKDTMNSRNTNQYTDALAKSNNIMKNWVFFKDSVDDNTFPTS